MSGVTFSVPLFVIGRPEQNIVSDSFVLNPRLLSSIGYTSVTRKVKPGIRR